MMNSRNLLLLAAVGIVVVSVAHSQAPPIPTTRPSVGPTDPNRFNRDLEKIQEIQKLDEQRRADDQRTERALSKDGKGLSAQEQATAKAQVAKFLEAIKSRKRQFPDFDQVVTHGNAPVTPAMLGLMSESHYAADIAYFLGKHPAQSVAIAKMEPGEARAAVQQIESLVAAEAAGRKK